jgi:hypothetical protein
MQSVKEPVAGAFFASSSGVCCYVVVGRHSIRVEFRAPDSVGVTRGVSSPDAEQASAAATASLQRYRAELIPLFAHVAAELASRAGGKA